MVQNPQMNLLIVVPGGVHHSGEINVIPALCSLLGRLSCQHRVLVIALNQTDTLCEYQLQGCSVISLPKVRIKKILSSTSICVNRLKHYGFKPDIVHSFWLGQTTLLAAILSKHYRSRLVTSIAGGEPVDMPDIGYGGSQKLMNRVINRLGLSMSHTITCGSEFIQALSIKKWNIKPELIPLGIDSIFWSHKKSTKVSNDYWQLLHLSSVNLVKDPWLQLEILSQLKQASFKFHLNWIGGDTLNGAVQQKSEKMGLAEQVTFYGFKTQTQLRDILENQHFVIQTSCYESQGIAMAEACSQGICPVGTSVGWLNDLQFGITAPRNLLAKKIANEIILLAQSNSEREARIRKAQEWIRENDVTATLKKFNRCYSKLLE